MTATPTDRDAFVASNRIAWDRSAAHHYDNPRWRELAAGFRQPGYTCLDPIETKILQSIGVAGRDVAQLCCNNGRELLSLRNMGARRCVGFDQSAAFLEQARQLAEIAGQDCEFVRADVYNLPDTYDASFDLVVITIGVLGWMPDLAAFAAVVARLLRPGGTLFVYEQHPVLDMFDPTAADPFEAKLSYFQTEPHVVTGPIVYDGTRPAEEVVSYWFGHPLSQVLMSFIGRGLAIEHIEEYSHNITSAEYEVFLSRGKIMPMCYTLVGRKRD